MISLIARTSSASLPIASPCAAAVSVYFGDGNPMWLRSTMTLGRSASAMPSRIARSSASRSLAISPASMTCQPYALKRSTGSSVSASSVGPSIVMWLSS